MQKSFADLEYAAKRKTTRRERFLAELERITPWSELLAALAPFYPKGGGRGRPPIGLERMLRMYIVQQSLGLSDEGIEDALYDSQAIRQFVGLDLGRESAPDATTLLKFRRLLETHQLTETIFATIRAHLASQGLMLREGTIVDATIIAAPSSTRNAKGERDAEMHQTRKGKQWHFGMKAHIGVDAASGLVHTVIGTAANVNDVTQAQALLHGDEREGYGDAGYQGADKRPEARGKVRWNIAMRPGKRRTLDMSQAIDRLRDQLETIKARIRARVKHPFHIIKNRFGLKKVRYQGLAKNTAQLMTLFALANLMIAKQRLLGLNAQGVS
ncbi:IS5 family transposase [Laribacter hongkongensis]|uniref:IS5 family transposase n=1 Tax=Laribacter hongkongensis TaxID=168471 RepID=UPI001EFE8066|nr:IS5 family transposase [Laribacter hongkongensis]MCG9059791.1 IS5 family transposase [Laribacter hongkongensis]MCG9086531.1 IS5 family transposase [Laribacter hongkongensis]